MVVVALLLLSSLFSLTFVFLYSIFFPWWKSRLGKSLVMSKGSTGLLLVLAALHLLNFDLGAAIFTVGVVVSLTGIVAANVGMLVELYGSWKYNGSRKTD